MRPYSVLFLVGFHRSGINKITAMKLAVSVPFYISEGQGFKNWIQGIPALQNLKSHIQNPSAPKLLGSIVFQFRLDCLKVFALGDLGDFLLALGVVDLDGEFLQLAL